MSAYSRDTIGFHLSRAINITTYFVDNQEEYKTIQSSGYIEYIENESLVKALQEKYVQHKVMKFIEEEIRSKAKVLEDFGFTPEQASRAKVLRGKGCPKCKDTGYKGRMGIYEVLNVTKPIKEAILAKATTPELKAIAQKEGFRTMGDMGREMILSGDLNFREFDRVLSME